MASNTNIVFIQCDSMDGRIMGCMNHPAMEHATPNLDNLAKHGVLFRNAYCNNPICCPSRASMWSGKFTHHCEGWNNYKGLSENDPTFENQLKEAGYQVQTFGKTDYLSGYHSVRARVSAWTRSANIKRPHYRMGLPEVLDNYEKRVHKADWDNVDRSIAWLKEVTQSDKPFILYVGINAPHPEFKTSKYYLELIDEDGIDIPPLDNCVHPVIAYQRIIKNWQYGFSDEMVKKVRNIYFAMISEVDAMVGKIFSTIEELGLDKSTYIIFASDHGELAMEHQQFYKMSFYEPSARIPIIIAGPSVIKNTAVDDVVSLVDIYPTLMDMAETDHPEDLDGYSIMPYLTGRPSTHPDWVIGEYHDSSCNTGSFMLIHNGWKYIAYPGYRPQLFDIKNDPWEIHDMSHLKAGITKEMDELLQSIVDYKVVDAKVKAYDKESFDKWRSEQKQLGMYEKLMAQVHSGWDNLTDKDIIPWTDDDEAIIEHWLSN